MKKKSTVILLSMAVLVSALLIFTFVKVDAQDQNAAEISSRLNSNGVPVKEALITSRLPYRVSITLQSASGDNHLTPPDRWNLLLAQHEATFAYRWGPRLSSFQLVVLNTLGEEIYSVETFLHPQDLDQANPTGPVTSVDDAAAAEIIRSGLNLGSFTVTQLDVTRSLKTEPDSQVAQVNLSAPDLAAANQSLVGLLGSFFQLMDTINQQDGTALVLVHLQIMDEKGTVLLDYFRDLESGYALWNLSEGLNTDWFPHPPPDGQSNINATSPPSGTSYPAPGESQPASTPALKSYP